MITDRILKRAIKSALKSNVVRGKVSAVAFTNDNIITHAHNATFLGSRFIKTVHAEQALCNKLDKIDAWHRYKGINIVVIRYRKGTKTFANAKPCNECSKRLKTYKDLKVWYTNEDGIIEELL
jgi:deoxycytidylate deaminase